MANTKKYLSHLLQNTGITPACSEEERAAADVIAKVFENHGFIPEMQEFSASGSAKIVQAGLGIVAFLGSVLMGIGGAIGIVGLLLVIAAAVLFVMERTGRPVLSQMGSGGLSQNVIAYHKASGPLASPRNRPVVVVAHYDSPRVDLLSQQPYASYRAILVKLLPFAMVAPAIIAVLRLFPFPDAAKIVLWILAIVAALIPLANAIAIIANRFVLPYTTGAVCNMSSVAAMLGVMDAVSPYELGEEFTSDQPADEYFAEQQRIYDEAVAAAEAAAAAAAAEAAAYPHELEGEDAAEGEDAESVDSEVAADDTSDEALVAEFEPVAETGVFEAVDLDGVELEEGDEVVASEEIPVVEMSPEATSAMDLDELASAAAAGAAAALDPNATLAAMPVIEDEPYGEVEQTAFDFEAADEFVDEAEPSDEPPFHVNNEGNVRFGADVVRSLGMLPSTCTFVYEDDEPELEDEPTAFDLGNEAASYGEAEQEYDETVEEIADEDDLVYEEEPVYEDEVYTEDEAFAEAEDEVEESDDEVFVEGEYVEEADYIEETDGLEEADYAADDQGDESVEELNFDEPVVAADAEAAYEEQQLPLGGETVQFTMPATDTHMDPSGTVAMPAMPAQPVETVDSLMAEISRDVPAPTYPEQHQQQRLMNLPSTADAPTPHTPASANRASLFELPDPSAAPLDPFASSEPVPAPPAIATDESAAEARSAFTVISSNEPAGYADPEKFDRIETISPVAPAPEKPRRGLSRFFGRKKKQDDSMSEWLGVDDGFDAKSSGSDIGSWDNFDDDDGWKGGAAGFDGATEEELREAITNMGDDELLGHDIWFVATGASENGNAGIRAFLDTHRSKLRGVFLINLECVGAGQIATLATEGEQRTLKGDKRIMKLVQRVSADFHHPFESVDMPHVTTDAYAAMSMSLRSLTIGGVDGANFALSHTEDDQPYNVDLDNVALVSDVVTEVIRRS